MSTPEARLQEMGLSLPTPAKVPPGVHIPFSFINQRGNRLIFSGHPMQGPDGQIVGPFGRLGDGITTQEGYDAARGVALSVLAKNADPAGNARQLSDQRLELRRFQWDLLWKSKAKS